MFSNRHVLVLIFTLFLAAPSAYSLTPIELIALTMRSVSSDRIGASIKFLADDFGPRHADFHAPFIDNKCTLDPNIKYPQSNVVMAAMEVGSMFKKMGYRVDYEPVPLVGKSGESTGYNVVATRIGKVFPGSFIEVGGHLDSRPTTPGAEDNAVGVAGVLETATVLAAYPSRYSLRFIAFVGHEHQGLQNIGSMLHIDLARKRAETIKAALILDGIGISEASPKAMSVMFYRGEESRRIADLYCTAQQIFQVPSGCRVISDEEASDNLSYWIENETAVLTGGAFPYPMFSNKYHNCADVSKAINLEYPYRATQLTVAVVMMLDAENNSSNNPPQTQHDAAQKARIQPVLDALLYQSYSGSR